MNKLYAALLCSCFVIASSALSESALGQKVVSKPQISPKCAFLRQQRQRVVRGAQDFADASPLSHVTSAADLSPETQSIADLGAYIGQAEAFAARVTILAMAIADCDRGLQLSDVKRLATLTAVQVKHVRRVQEQWAERSGDDGKAMLDMVVTPVSAVYQAEAQSYYAPKPQVMDDPDVAKDFSALPSDLSGSALDSDTKTFLLQAYPHLRYEEAGQVWNAIQGVDKERGLTSVYLIRKAVAERLNSAQAKATAQEQQQSKNRMADVIDSLWYIAPLLLVLLPLWLWLDRRRAKMRAFQYGLKSSPFWFGNAVWIFWDPGETVILLERKRLRPMVDPGGGYCVISPWREQEYKGRISYKTQFSTWISEPIHTSDGLAVNLSVGIWWKISDPGTYVSAIASDYHDGNQHHRENLQEAAEVWIQKLAAGTLREKINQLPAEKLISPYVQSYIQVRRPDGANENSSPQEVPRFADQLDAVKEMLAEKTIKYGIQVERLEVQELILPPVYQKKLEAVRVAFLEPIEANALTEAQTIALRGLASVIGADKVGLIEVLKHVNLSHVGFNPYTGVIPVLQPLINTLQKEAEKSLPPSAPRVQEP